jgi:hypothetical protein
VPLDRVQWWALFGISGAESSSSVSSSQ